VTADPPIVTGEAVALELRPAGVGSRGVALVIDMVAQFLLAVAWIWAISRTGASGDTAAVEAAVLSLFVATVLGYPVGFETLWRGRTPGKAVMGLRVVRDDGGPIRFRHAFVRGLVGVVVDRPGLSSGLAALIPMLATKRSKRLGDLAAGTVVVQERVPARMSAPPQVPAELRAWAGGLDLTGVTDDLAMQVRAFLGRAQQLSPDIRDDMGNRLLTDLSRSAGPLPPGMSPWTYLQTVLAERSRRETHRLSGAATGVKEPERPTAQPPGPFSPPS
jgi:uncharacterized RDD family membrane protein YckC